MRKTRKIRENKKGIDTILAALLMVVIVVVAAVMVYAWATGLLGTLLVHPTTGNEAMNMETYAWNPNGANTYNVTLNIRNTGTASITLASYYVKDSSSDQYARINWQTDTGYNHPAAIAPNAVGLVTITIGVPAGNGGGAGGQCGANNCTYTGTAGAFNTFTSGYSYTITVVTSRNNQFTFTVNR